MEVYQVDELTLKCRLKHTDPCCHDNENRDNLDSNPL